MDQVLPPDPERDAAAAADGAPADAAPAGSAPETSGADRDAGVTRVNPARQHLGAVSLGTAPAPLPGEAAGNFERDAAPTRAPLFPGVDRDAAPTRAPLFPGVDRDAEPTRAPLFPGVDRDAGLTEPHDPDGAPTAVLTVASHRHRSRRRDWRWVEEWRAEGEKPAWGPGLAVAGFVAAIVAVAVIVLTAGVADAPVLAVAINLVIAAGMAPALWLSRTIPVLRFLAGGAAVGLVIGWFWMIATS